MKTPEQILSQGPPFMVDPSVCMQHAEVIKAYRRPVETHYWSSSPLHVQLGFKVAFISICHQFNWDFMQDTLAKNILGFGEDLPEKLSVVSSKNISEWLKDYPKQERVRSAERAKLLRNVGEVLCKKYDGNLAKFHDECSSVELENGGFHRLMNGFVGYSTDVLQKKTNVLSHDLVKEGIVQFKDEQHIKPAIDYHIMRLYLRTGRVVAADTGVYRFLRGAPNPRTSLVKNLRKTVSEAEELVAYYSGLNVADVNYIEWQIGRSICLNAKPLCVIDNSVINIAADVGVLCSGGCPYVSTCSAKNRDAEFLDFEEPNYVSSDY